MADVVEAVLLHVRNTIPDVGITLMPGGVCNALYAGSLGEFLVASSLLSVTGDTIPTLKDVRLLRLTTTAVNEERTLELATRVARSVRRR